MITSNLAPSDVADYYDARLADRFREMMHIVNFSNDPSFRTVDVVKGPIAMESKKEDKVRKG